MAIYSVHNRDGASDEQAVFVAESFSAGALVFTVLWAAWHRMWLAASVLLAVTGGTALAGNYFGISESMTALVSFAVSLIFGFEARELYARSLVARGMAQVGLSHGRNLEEAELRYYHRARAGGAPSMMATPKLPQPIHAPDTLGIFGNV